MKNKNNYGPGAIAPGKLLLRRTLVHLVILFGTCITVSPVMAQQATWIWYPGDFEISLSNQMQNRRTDRGSMSPVFWKIDNHYVLINFHRLFELGAPEVLNLTV
jgi:alpha-L-rhamnosidase